ncbi:hypothetical protein BB558_002052 [Smittium angustum]|uniref:PX domain-containing protein n=1 Tax=Smittium angustum TaxID=133377 RepID=A0A2U1J9M1_SMIAN|nr:hypothetical protein BB558_002052 [Smittium angustum]
MNFTSDDIDNTIDPFKDQNQPHANSTQQDVNNNQQIDENNTEENVGIQQNSGDKQQSMNVKPSKTGENSEMERNSLVSKLILTLKDSYSKNTAVRMYRFDVFTNLISYKRRKYVNIERNHTEFERLAKHLAVTYPQCLVLSFPSGTTKSSVIHHENDGVIRDLVQSWMNWVTSHPILQKDYELRKFVEAPFIFNPAIVSFNGEKARAEIEYENFSESKLGFFTGWSGKRKVKSSPIVDSDPKGSNGQNKNKNSGKQKLEVATIDQRFELAGIEFEQLSEPLLKARDATLKLAQQHVAFVRATSDLATQFIALGHLESNVKGTLGNSMIKLGKVQKNVSDTIASIAIFEGTFPTFYLETLSRNNTDIQRSLVNRKNVFKDYDDSKQVLEKKKQAITVLRSSSTIIPKTFRSNRQGLIFQMLKSWALEQVRLERQVLEEYKTSLKYTQILVSGKATADKNSKAISTSK